MEALLRSKRVVRLSIVRAQEQLDQWTKGKKSVDLELLSKLEILVELTLLPNYQRYKELVNDILVLFDTSKVEDIAQEENILKDVDSIHEIVATSQAKIRSFRAKLTAKSARESIVSSPGAANQSITSQNQSFGAQLKLQKIDIPKFDGQLTQFYNFKNLFSNLVHENPELTNVQKLYYLKQALIGDAGQALCDFELSDGAYSEAWSYFLSRYENGRAILEAHFRNFANLSQIKDESSIRSLLDQVNVTIRGIKVCGEKIDDSFSKYIAYHVSSRLDFTTLKDWKNSLTSIETFPTYGELEDFLKIRAFAVEDRRKELKVEPKVFDRSIKKEEKKQIDKKSFSIVKTKCQVCSGNHLLSYCSDFRAKKPQDRYEIVKANRLCLICFNSGHRSDTCTLSTANFACDCGAKHNRLLHFQFKSPKSENAVNQSSTTATNRPVESEPNKTQIATKSSMSCSFSNPEGVVLLPTAVVKFSIGGIQGSCRILLDSASQATLISDSFVKKFKIPVSSSRGILLKGVGPGSTSTLSFVNLNLSSKFESFECEIDADVVPAASISYAVKVMFPAEVLNSLNKFQLADDQFVNVNASIAKVDIVLGAQYYDRCVMGTVRQIERGLHVRLTHFGWTLSGVAPQREMGVPQFSGCTIQSIDARLSKFWELEEPLVQKISNSETDECVKHFEETFKIGSDGRFIVKLPFKVDRNLVADNRRLALMSFYRVEKKLIANGELKIAYSAFMKEYLELGHMSVASPTPNPKYYIPHREVIREDSTTTPTRVVFNATSSSGDNLSLNKALMKGPTIQRDLFDILISMRSFNVCYSADITKMYRMIWIDEGDRDMQRIFWREDPSHEVQEFCLNTVTYGTVTASFLATKCLMVIADRVRSKNPTAARLIEDNFYMDDLLAGGDSLEEVVSIQSTIHNALLENGFQLRKYSSNSKELLQNIPSNLHAQSPPIIMEDSTESISILGLAWNPDRDTFQIKLNIELLPSSDNITKRIVLSYISRTFDPLGLISPVLIRGKILLQLLWLEGKSWDDSLSSELSISFIEYIRDLQKLAYFEIPRSIFGANNRELVVFCDASEKAYCAVVYLRVVDEFGVVSCRLICSKTRVAPLKAITIPKLELCAALLAAVLAKRVATYLGISMSNVSAFSDSTVALCWLSRPANLSKTFVCNRVNKIADILPFSQWNYVNTTHNPSDLATRGLKVDEFRNNRMWIDGPSFVREPNFKSYFVIPNLSVHDALEKRKSVLSNFNIVEIALPYINNFSSYLKMVNVTAYILRFVNNCRNKLKESSKILTLEEINQATVKILYLVQLESFNLEMSHLLNNRLLKKKSSLLALTPFLDRNNVMRVGGRIEKSEFSFDKKHPIILHAKSHFSKIFVRYIHEKYFHAGSTFLSSYFASQFWFVGGRNQLFKFITRTCVTCCRFKAQTLKQIMADLPSTRVTVSHPFTHTGVDFAGPFQCHCVGHRSTRHFKIYTAIFVCFVTRAVHIEIVSDLSSDRFIAALQRFISRRGIPANIYSDNGTNFQGASSFFASAAADIQEFANKERFRWSFIPAYTPHQGGIWEAAVKAAKFHMKRVVNGHALTFEEYNTLFSRIEAILNSRPLCYSKSSVQQEAVLTPSHFLIGQPLTSFPILEDPEQQVSLSRRASLMKSQLLSFWSSWSKDYIAQLQTRSKWQKKMKNIEVGTVVVVREPNSPPFVWPLAIVEEVYPDKSGQVRRADVRINGSTRLRSISSLVPLPLDEHFGSSGGSMLL